MNNNTKTKLKLKDYDREEIPEEKVKEDNGQKIERLLKSPLRIIDITKVPNKEEVCCLLEDGTKEIVAVAPNLQLLYDKMEMKTIGEIKKKKDKVEVFPFLNKIMYIDGETGKTKKSAPLDQANLYYKITPIKRKKGEQFDSRLNPAILAILEDDFIAQNDYISGDGNLDVIYNFRTKAYGLRANISNRNLAKRMDSYYKSEIEYAEELGLKNQLSCKVGYVDFLEKVKMFIKSKKSTLKLPWPKDEYEKQFKEEYIKQSKEDFKKSLQAYQSKEILQKSSVPNKEISQNKEIKVKNKVLLGIDR